MEQGGTEVFIVTDRWKAAGLDDPPDDSIVGTPPRAPGSVRRSSHINMTWPDGADTPMHIDGRSRDLLTDRQGVAAVLGEAEMHLVAGPERSIEAIATVPEHATIEALVGAKGGQNFRSAIDSAIPGEREAAPLEVAAQAGNATLHGAGIGPGAATELFPLLLSVVSTGVTFVFRRR